jgi:hypothetical protein
MNVEDGWKLKFISYYFQIRQEMFAYRHIVGEVADWFFQNFLFLWLG